MRDYTAEYSVMRDYTAEYSVMRDCTAEYSVMSEGLYCRYLRWKMWSVSVVCTIIPWSR